MWVIFHDPRTHYTHIDKNVIGVVNDKDILVFQKSLADSVQETSYFLVEGVSYLQPFVGNHYYAKRYEPITQCIDILVQPGQKAPGTLKASLSRDAVPLSLYSNGQ
jgi:hypothetical protein